MEQHLMKGAVGEEVLSKLLPMADYELLEQIGEGAYGYVCKAREKVRDGVTPGPALNVVPRAGHRGARGHQDL